MKATLAIFATLVSLVAATAEPAPGGYRPPPPPCTTSCPAAPTTYYVKPTYRPRGYYPKPVKPEACPSQKPCPTPQFCALFLVLENLPCHCPLSTTVTGCPTACTPPCHNTVWQHSPTCTPTPKP